MNNTTQKYNVTFNHTTSVYGLDSEQKAVQLISQEMVRQENNKEAFENCVAIEVDCGASTETYYYHSRRS